MAPKDDTPASAAMEREAIMVENWNKWTEERYKDAVLKKGRVKDDDARAAAMEASAVSHIVLHRKIMLISLE